MSRGNAIDRFGVVGFNHRQLPARLRGRLSFDGEWSAKLAGQIKDAQLADGIAFISTCNRQEIVLSSAHPAFALELVRAQLHGLLGDDATGPIPEPYRHVGEEAVRHVLRVSASLDSLVVGERQITQQLRRSFDDSRKAGWLDKSLNGLARIAVENAKEIHARTSIGEVSVGVFTLARDLVAKETKDLEKPRVAVVGLGEIGLKTARAIAADRRYSVTISSRRARSADELGSTLEGCPFLPLEALPTMLADFDAVILATGSSRALVDDAMLQTVRANVTRPLVLVDLGIPPLAMATCDEVAGTRLYNLDWFATTGFGQRALAREALRQAQEIVEEGVQRVAAWTSVRRHSGLFETLVALSDQHKLQGIPATLKTELSVLSPEHQRLVADAMHRLLTSYASGVFQTVTRELVDRSPPLAGADDADRTPTDHRQPRE